MREWFVTWRSCLLTQLRERGRAVGVRHRLEHVAWEHDRRRVERQGLESVLRLNAQQHHSQVTAPFPDAIQQQQQQLLLLLLLLLSDVVWDRRSRDKTGLRAKSSVLVLVLQVCCCVQTHGLVTLVVIMILKDTATFQVLLGGPTKVKPTYIFVSKIWMDR